MTTFFRPSDAKKTNVGAIATKHPGFDLLAPLRRWVDNINITSASQAHFICRLIPCDCPFEHDVKLFGRKLFHIPPLCKLNPLYMECVALRFRALTYLTDVCGEDVRRYIC
ncbi:MAG: Mo-dependent nitrogenase C-terminal domain-containing protein [Synechococcales bacterium]|nr:Mo-dependent nitrogenase C-terminal domain-containing protein [Synechococcales bacterium]